MENLSLRLEVSVWPHTQNWLSHFCCEISDYFFYFVPHSTIFFIHSTINHFFFTFLEKILTGKIKKVKKQIELLEKKHRKKGISTSPLKKIQQFRRTKKKFTVATSTPKAKPHKFVESIETDDSDCELIEQPSTLIILEDGSDSDTSSPRSNSREANSSGEHSNPVRQLVEVEPKQVDEIESSCMFYEDREPTTDFTVPLYDSVQCMLVDSSNENIERKSQPIDNEMMTIRNDFNNQNGARTIKDRLGFRCQKFVVENATDSSSPKNVSIDTPSVPIMRVRISVEPTEKNEVATRTCTITSSSADSSEPTVEPSKAKNHVDAREVLRAKNGSTASATPAQPNPFKITFTNENAPSTSAAVENERNVLKRRRQDSDVILIDDTFKNNRQDDSVIFVSESINCGRPVLPLPRKRKGGPTISYGKDFIPIGGAKRESPVAKNRKTKSTRAQRKADKKIVRRLQNSRTEQPSSIEVRRGVEPSNHNNNSAEKSKDSNEREKRMIFIDGSNVAFK